MPPRWSHGDTNRSRRRRRLLQLTGGAILGGLAGCMGQDSPSDGDDADGGSDGDGEADGGDGGTDGGGDDGTDGGGDDGDGGTDGGEDASYPTQEIRWIVPYGAGGAFDVYSRGVAEFMPNHLPNDVSIRVENVTGAGGRRGTTEIYRAEPDGYTIGVYNVPGIVVAQLVEDVRFDLNEVTWMGNIAQGIFHLFVAADSEFETVDDVLEADQVRLAVPGLGSSSSVISRLVAEAMEIDAELVSGYDGSAEAATAVIRGDADLRMSTWADSGQYVDDGDMRTLMSLNDELQEGVPEDTPTAAELGYDELVGTAALQRPVGAPPDLDESAASTLESALLDTLESDEFGTWADENDLPVHPAGAEETAQIIRDTFELFEQYQDLFDD